MLEELERKLSSLSHTDEALRVVQNFCETLSGTKERIQVWNAENALIRRPISPQVVYELGFNTPDDTFTVLQGDVVRTESAYFMGERIVGRPKYAIVNSSCDLVPGRTTYSSLLRILEIKKDEADYKQKLGQLLKFGRRDSMYMPPLPDDDEDVLGNAIHFDGICQIRTADLLLANRVASLSLVGWRIFASFTRVVVARANPREILIRTAIETNKQTA